MNNIIMNLDQVAYAILAFVIMAKSFSALNCCTKETRISIRVPLVLFFASSTGILLLIISGILVHWVVGVLLLAIAFHLIGDKRGHITLLETPHLK